MKECSIEVDTGERLRENHEGTFHWSRHRRKVVLLKQACERTCDVWRYINRTQRTVTKAELGLLIELAIQCLWVSCLHWSSLPWEKISWHSCWLWSLLLTGAEAEAWLSLLGSADSCLLSGLYWTRLLVYPWSVCEWIELLPLTCELNCKFPDNTDGSCSKEPF